MPSARPRLTRARGDRQGHDKPRWEPGQLSCSELSMPHGRGADQLEEYGKEVKREEVGEEKERREGRGKGKRRGRENQAFEQVW